MKLKRLSTLALSLALVSSLAVVPAHAAFTDVSQNDWYYDDVTAMSQLGYAKGYEDGSFKPNGKMTAAETLLFCTRATGVDPTLQKKIAADHAKEMEELLPDSMISWAGAEMAVALEAGVLSKSELEALSDAGALLKTITRENICMYLVRAMQLEPLAQSLTNYSLSNYTDADEISPNLRPYVYVLTTFGIVQGDQFGAFYPKPKNSEDTNGYVTRAQMTTMLRRALDFMEDSGIQVELSEYTDYDWQGGTITNVASGADKSIILTLYNELTDQSQSYSLSAGVKIYENNMLTDSNALKAGQYVRLNLNSRGAVESARLGGALTTYGGSISALEGDQLTILVNGLPRTMFMDRFTQVSVGRNLGGRELIDEGAGYTAAVCYVDETGHLAGVKLSGGTQQTEGLIQSVSTASNGVTTLGVTAFNGVVYQYTVPAGVAVTVDGVLGSLSSAQVGKYVQLRINSETNQAAFVTVNTSSNYVQGPVRKLGTTGTAKNVTIADIFTGKTVTPTISQSAPITYNGNSTTLDKVETGWYVTALISGNMVTQLDGFQGTAEVEGTLTSISYGTTITIQVVQEDGSELTYELDITDLPDITRDKKTSSFDQLRTGDEVVITIRYNEVERISATPQTADMTGTIDRIVQTRTGIEMEVQLPNGETNTYTVGEGVSVSQNNASSNIYALKPGHTVAMVTNGDEVISIEITGTISSASTLTGTVLLTGTSGTARTMTVQVTDTLGKVSLVNVDVKNANLMDLSGKALSLTSGFKAGDLVIAYGSYDGATFVATIVIKQS